MAGPLDGTRVIELAGIGPGPFAGMMLADMGAEVIRVDRLGGNPHGFVGHTTMFRGRRNIAVNLKSPEGVETVLRLAEGADAMFEGFRPGVAERLGVGPDVAMARNPRLVYGRMTGWGQDGPLAGAAGHDINYIALSGALHAIGEPGRKPVVPLNLVGDFGGGGMLLAFGMVCALLSAQRTGEGQVVDAAMVDGAGALMQMFFSMRAQGLMSPERGANLLDGGAPFYDTFRTADDRWISIGSIEPQFFALLRQHVGLDDPLFDNQMDPSRWPEQRAAIADAIASKTRDEWDEILGGTDVCYAPVLELGEVADHPHHAARSAHVEIGGVVQPAPAPRFSGTPAATPVPAGTPGDDTVEVLTEAGFEAAEVEAMLASGAIGQAPS